MFLLAVCLGKEANYLKCYLSKKNPTEPWNIPQVPQNTNMVFDFLHEQVVEGLGYVPGPVGIFLELKKQISSWKGHERV